MSGEEYFTTKDTKGTKGICSDQTPNVQHPTSNIQRNTATGEPETRNQEPETRDSELGTRNSGGSARTRLVFLVGQTATGKGAAGFELAKRIGAEILSLDSMKIYRGMDIGTAKPPAERRCGTGFQPVTEHGQGHGQDASATGAAVRYHLLDLADPSEHFSTALYVRAAETAIAEIIGRGAVPLFVGGTVLYLKALTEGLFEGPGADAEFRSRIRREAAELGTAVLHERLGRVDPAAAARIHPNDLRRIERALEVFELTGRPISELQTQFGRPSEKYESVILGLRREEADLHERIARRVDAMMAAGWLDEVRRLTGSGTGALGKEASQAVGYKELAAHLRGECSLEEAVELVKLRTRQFAKAQRTWFKRIPGIWWLDVAKDEPAESVTERLHKIVQCSREGVTGNEKPGGCP